MCLTGAMVAAMAIERSGQMLDIFGSLISLIEGLDIRNELKE